MVATRSNVQTQTAWVVLTDLACLLAGGLLAVGLRIGAGDFGDYFLDHIDGLVLFLGSIIVANYLAGGYRLQYAFSRFNLVVTWIFSLIFALVVLNITSYAWFEFLIGRGVLFFWIALYSVMSLGTKILIYQTLFRSRLFVCRTVIVGVGRRARELRQILEGPVVLPIHEIVAFVTISRPAGEDAASGSALPAETPSLVSTPADLPHLVHRLGADLIVVGLDDPREAARLYPQLRRLRFEGIEVLLPLSVVELYTGRTPLDLVSEESLTQLSMESRLPMVRRAKRLLDILISLVVSLVLLPVAALVALSIKLSAPRSPVLYTQLRVGQFGKAFRIIKFRTMHPDAEKATGPVWSGVDDPRITRLGRVLRQSRLDEIPQFVNILKGEMSLVGPRPERPSISAEMAKNVPFFDERENIMPGLTGWAQIRYPYGSTVEDAARKLEYDLYYVKHMSLSLDLQIILSTIRIVMLGKERSH